MTNRLLRFGQTNLPSLLRPEQLRQNGTVSTFFKKVKEGIDSNPELKKSLDQVKERTQGITETLAKASQVAKDATGQLKERTSKTASSMQDQVRSTAEAYTRSAEQPTQQSATQQAHSPSTATTQPDPTTTAADSSQQQQQSSETASAGKAGNEMPSQDESSARRGDTSTSGYSRQQSGSSRKATDAKAEGLMNRLRSVREAIRKEVAAAIMPMPRTESATRARPEGVRPAETKEGAPSAVMVVQQKQSAWQRQWQSMQSRLGAHPFFRSFMERAKVLGNNPVVEKVGNLKEDIRERWETTENPTVQRFQDMKDNMFAETEPALALKEIRSRDPNFDMVKFLYNLKVDVPVVIQAYLRGQVDILKEHCSKDMVERLSGIIAAQTAQGLHSDPTILDTSEVELVDLKFLEEDPVVVVQFTCQQINCSRDKFGNVVDGRPDDVQRVYYYWALAMEHGGFVGSDGVHYPPRWQLKEMMVRGMHNLL
ncbi:hypothetical protein ABBQ38_007481 [Trebouxia sp. C0009 RCD-2024]